MISLFRTAHGCVQQTDRQTDTHKTELEVYLTTANATYK